MRNGFLKRITAYALAVVVAAGVVPANALAIDSTKASVDIKSGTSITLEDLFDAIKYQPEERTLKKAYSLNVTDADGDVLGNVAGEITVEDYYSHVKVDDETAYNLVDNRELSAVKVTFPSTGDYAVYNGDAEYKFDFNKESDWYKELNELIVDYNGKKDKVEELETNRADLEKSISNLQTLYDTALKEYNEAVAALQEIESSVEWGEYQSEMAQASNKWAQTLVAAKYAEIIGRRLEAVGTKELTLLMVEL